jgi:hypothetical protein
MTLAVILLVSIFTATSPAASTQSTAQQAATASAPTDTPATQDQATTPPAQNSSAPSSSPSSTTPAKKSTAQPRSAAAKRRHHKKRVLPPNCDNAQAPVSQGAAGSSPAPADPAAPGTTPAPGTPNPCPPPKVIVRQGGTSEPSIQLAGGSGGNQVSHQKDTANQMLDATEENLKKIAERQLSSEQQDMVNQIHQFRDQSKAAVAAGDLDRARTLAWKAQVLSEELVKPETK